MVGPLVGIAVAVAWFLAIAWTGSTSADTALWCFAVLAAVLVPGFALVRAVRREAAPLVEDLAWAVPGGCLVALTGWFLDHLTASPIGAYGFGPLFTAALIAIPATRQRVLARPAPGWGPLPALALGGVQMVAIGWMLQTGLQAFRPDPGVAGYPYYPDDLYDLDLVGELHHHLAPTYPPVAGQTLSYHWFLFAITDHLTTGTGVNVFDATLRLGPASLIPATLMLVAVVARRLADRVWAGPLAAALLGAVELSQASRWSTEDGSLGMLHRAWINSTPQALGWMSGLAAAGTVIAFVRRSPPDRAIPVWLLLPFLLLAAGSKSAELADIGGGLFVAFLAVLVLRRRFEIIRCFIAGLLCGVTFGIAWGTIYSGSSYGERWSPLATIVARVAGMFPNYYTVVSSSRLTGRHFPAVAVWAELALWVLPLLPRLAGLVFQVRYRPDAAGWFCFGTALTGFLFALLTGHPAGSQVYFMQSAYPIGVAGAAAGLVLAADRVRGALGTPRLRRAAAGVATVLVVGGGLTSLAIAVAQPRLDPVDDWNATHPGVPLSAAVSVGHLAWEWIRPNVTLGVVILDVVVVALVLKWGIRAGRRLPRAPFAGLAAVCVALGSGVFTMWLTFQGATDAVHGSPGVVAQYAQISEDAGILPTMRDAFQAGEYVNKHAGTDDVVATNMFCRYTGAARSQGAPCDARNFLASAVTERRTLLGGWGYANQAVDDAWDLEDVTYMNQPFWDPQLYDEQYQAFSAPTADVLADLYLRYNVRWIFVDLRDPPVDVPDLDRLATLRFMGPSTAVWQLRAPAHNPGRWVDPNLAPTPTPTYVPGVPPSSAP